MIMNKTVKTLLLSIILTALFCGCDAVAFWHPDYDPSDNGGRVSVKGVSLIEYWNIPVGITVQLSPDIYPSNATNQNVTWRSSAPSVAFVDQYGSVNGVSEGSAIITVTTVDGGKTATCTFTVTSDTFSVPVTSVSLSETSISLYIGASNWLFAIVMPEDATNKNVTWSSSNPAVATVSNGTVIGVSVGSATITVTTADGGYSASCSVYVNSSTVSVTDVSLSKTTLSLEVGDSETLTTTVMPSNATNKSVSWSSSVPSVVTVLPNGLVTAVSAGSATIAVTTTDGNFTATCTITVTTSNSISPSALASHLASLPVNSEYNPHTIAIKVSSEGDFNIIKTALDGANNKYVDLHLSSSNITEIPGISFNSCYNLVSITIGNGFTSIGNSAFWWNSGLVSATIGNSVTSIDDATFAGCENLTTIIVDSGNSAYTSENGVLYNKSKTSLHTYPAGKTSNVFSFLNSVTSINYYAFYKSINLTTINVDSGNNAFSSQDGVLYNKSKTTLVKYPAGKPDASFITPSGVTSIGNGAFQYCKSLINVTILSNVNIIGHAAFMDCSNLDSVILPNSVNRIASQTFQSCVNLVSINIPNSVNSIESQAFTHCIILASITIPNSVTRIETHAFLGCNSLANVTFQGTIPSIEFSTYSDTCPGDLRAKFYANNPSNGTPGTYITDNPGENAIWTRQ
jgi:uncharacterized protein YjdB